MEIISEPAYTEEHVEDVDIQPINGPIVSLTLREGETFRSADSLSGPIYEASLNSGERIVYLLSNTCWISRRSRTIKWPVKKPTPQTHE